MFTSLGVTMPQPRSQLFVFARTATAALSALLVFGAKPAYAQGDPQPPQPPEVTPPEIQRVTPAPSGPVEEKEAEPGIVERMETGLRWSIAPGIYFPRAGNPGFLFEVRVGYGIKTGPFITTPGVDGIFIFPPGTVIAAGMPTLKLTLPVGPVGPYVFGGVGGGSETASGQGGVATKVGGGLVVYPVESLGIGIEATYFTLVDTALAFTTVTPFVMFSL